MTGNTSTAGHAPFDESLLACVEDINKLLPGLGQRYDSTVIMGALAEHVGSALKVLMLRKVCNARQAQQVIRNLESSAFRKKPELRIVAAPQEAADTPPADEPEGATDET
jgi:hypothetical protein